MFMRLRVGERVRDPCARRSRSLDITLPTGKFKLRTASPIRHACARPSPESCRMRAGSQLLQAPLARTRSSWDRSVEA
jgi:hypothetical protein